MLQTFQSPVRQPQRKHSSRREDYSRRSDGAFDITWRLDRGIKRPAGSNSNLQARPRTPCPKRAVSSERP